MQPDSESVMDMNIVKKSSQGFQLLELEALLASGRVIEVYGEIDNDLAMNCVRQMLYYASEDKFTPVKILINTPGGSMDAGMLIYDVLQTSEVPFDVYCTGAAYSMGALLFATAPRGHRFILPHSKVMIHEPLVASNVVGKTSSVQDLADSLLATQERIIDLLAASTEQTKETLRKLMKKDTYFSAREAVDFGLADEICDFSKIAG